MRALARSKVDEISHYFLENIDNYMPLEQAKDDRQNKEKDKINKKATRKDIRLGLFANTQKGVRPYEALFDNAGITVWVP